jgi:hypothetical protein
LDSIILIGDAATNFNGPAFSLVMRTQNCPVGIIERLWANSSSFGYLNVDGSLHYVAAGDLNAGFGSVRPGLDIIGFSCAGTGAAISAVINGGTVATSSSLGQQNSGTNYLGTDPSGSTPLFGYVTRFTIWNSKLADATLKALTAP